MERHRRHGRLPVVRTQHVLWDRGLCIGHRDGALSATHDRSDTGERHRNGGLLIGIRAIIQAAWVLFCLVYARHSAGRGFYIAELDVGPRYAPNRSWLELNQKPLPLYLSFFYLIFFG